MSETKQYEVITLNENTWDNIATLKRELLDLVEMLVTGQTVEREDIAANLIRNLGTLQVMESDYINKLHKDVTSSGDMRTKK